MFSLIVPVYKSEANLKPLLLGLSWLSTNMDDQIEVVFVVDGSPDQSYDILMNLLKEVPFPAKLILLTKNEGSFAAIRAGLSAANGVYFGMIAADLQEPIELILQMYDAIVRDDLDVIIAKRLGREDRWMDRVASNLFWWAYRTLVMSAMPRGGFDTFVCNRSFRDQLLSLKERHTSLVAQILWLGGRRGFVSYARRKRQEGKSAWTLKKKISYLEDSVFSFTDLPIRILIYFGAITSVVSGVGGIGVFYARFSGKIVVPGYTALALLITFFGSTGLYAVGIVGSYAWRTYENTKNRPLFTFQAQTTFLPNPNNEIIE